TATVFDAGGGSVAGVPVTFSSDQGTVSPSVATTDSSGQATTTLTTSVDTTVTASSGTKTGTVKVTARSGPGITLTCAVGSGGCSSLTTTDASNSVTVVFTVTKPTSSSSLPDVTLDFGDGTSESLGNLPGGTATVPHT